MKVLGKINGTFITSDASICKENNKGGIGLIAVDKNNNNKILFEHSEQVDTEDAQYGEIYGIKTILSKIKNNQISYRKNFILL